MCGTAMHTSKAQPDIHTFALKRYSGMEKANKIIGGRRKK